MSLPSLQKIVLSPADLCANITSGTQDIEPFLHLLPKVTSVHLFPKALSRAHDLVPSRLLPGRGRAWSNAMDPVDFTLTIDFSRLEMPEADLKPDSNLRSDEHDRYYGYLQNSALVLNKRFPGATLVLQGIDNECESEYMDSISADQPLSQTAMTTQCGARSCGPYWNLAAQGCTAVSSYSGTIANVRL